MALLVGMVGCGGIAQGPPGGDGAPQLLWFGGDTIRVAGIASGWRTSRLWWWTTSGGTQVLRADLVRVGCIHVVLFLLDACS